MIPLTIIIIALALVAHAIATKREDKMIKIASDNLRIDSEYGSFYIAGRIRIYDDGQLIDITQDISLISIDEDVSEENHKKIEQDYEKITHSALYKMYVEETMEDRKTWKN